MKFAAFKEFRDIINATVEQLGEYLRTDLKKILRELQLGLTRLRFLDNFESFEETVTIAAGAELEIRNKLRSGETPNQKLIVRGKSGAESVVDGDTEWDKNFVYLKNVGASAATVTVIFLK